MLSLAGIFGKRPVVSVRNPTVGNALELLSAVGADVDQYNILDRETTVSISSSSADDDGAPAGTGALTVKIDGIDRNGAAATETVTMNGQTAVATTETYMKVTAVTALTFGVGAANAGDLYVIRAGESTLTAGVPDTISACMAIVAAAAITATAGPLSVSSSSANDDGAPVGTGALTLTVFGLDIYFKRQEETFTLNGQTAVVGTKYFRRVLGAIVATAGTGLVNAGDIYVVPAGSVTLAAGVPNATTNMLVKVPVGEGQAQTGIYTIPADIQNLYYKMMKLTLGVRGNVGHVVIQVRPLSGADNTEIKRVEFFMDSFTDGMCEIDLSHIPALIGPTDIELRGLSAAGAIMSAQLVLERQS
jgi:hypothetical protein